MKTSRKTATTKTTATSKADRRGLKEGYRSGLEELVADQLSELGVDAEYEKHTLKYLKPARVARYKPDFVLPNGIIVETKGRFVTADRQKHILINQQYPDLDIRFVFSNPKQKIGKKSSTSYAMWCEKHGFPYAAKNIPYNWVKEPVDLARLAANKRAFNEGA